MDNCEDEVEQLDVRTKWPDEALDFTPWLAKNLYMLGDAIGVNLEFIQTEVPVGPYFLDIQAKEADGGAIVAIENQLEMTDLHHLGQLLTYSTGCEAQIAVWVAPYFGYEHAQALHRLNEWTKDSIRFYGVKVEVIKQAGSDPAPRFRKVVFPGGWNKEATLPPETFAQPLCGFRRGFLDGGRQLVVSAGGLESPPGRSYPGPVLSRRPSSRCFYPIFTLYPAYAVSATTFLRL